MFIVLVYVHVKPDCVKAFTMASQKNAQNSVKEPGIARFDVIQQRDDKTRFILSEIYRDENAPAEHKKTTHYKEWRETVAEMMAEDRMSVKYENVFPDELGWG